MRPQSVTGSETELLFPTYSSCIAVLKDALRPYLAVCASLICFWSQVLYFSGSVSTDGSFKKKISLLIHLFIRINRKKSHLLSQVLLRVVKNP